MHRAVGLLLLGGLIASGQGYISEVVVDFAVKLMRNYWKRNSMDPDVINNFSRMYKNIFMVSPSATPTSAPTVVFFSSRTPR